MAKFVIALVLILAIANAGTLSKARRDHQEKHINSEAHFQALKNTAFGKNLFNMLSLKFQTGGKLQGVLDLLATLEQNIGQQQNNDQASFDTTSGQYKATIHDQVEIVLESTDKINADNAQIADDTDALSQASAQLSSLQAEADNINNFLVQLKAAREAEHEAFLARQADEEAMVEGLQLVIKLFTQVLNDDKDSDIDHDSAEQILTLLNEILASVQASLSEDRAAENDAQSKYDDFVDAQNERLAAIAEDVADLQEQISNLNNEINSLNADLVDQTKRRDTAATVRDNTQQALDDLSATFAANSQTRASQQALIQQVRAQLAANPDDVQAVLNGAI